MLPISSTSGFGPPGTVCYYLTVSAELVGWVGKGIIVDDVVIVVLTVIDGCEFVRLINNRRVFGSYVVLLRNWYGLGNLTWSCVDSNW